MLLKTELAYNTAIWFPMYSVSYLRAICTFMVIAAFFTIISGMSCIQQINGMKLCCICIKEYDWSKIDESEK